IKGRCRFVYEDNLKKDNLYKFKYCIEDVIAEAKDVKEREEKEEAKKNDEMDIEKVAEEQEEKTEEKVEDKKEEENK
ncbi:MAG: hypothetical protein E7D13_09485, partial [Finegoldia magna]|nr:hypothetical protein [Finegoldia magna]